MSLFSSALNSGDLPGLDLRVALTGNLPGRLRAIEASTARAARWAIEQVGQAAKHELRDDVIRSGIQRPRRLAATWRLSVYPRGGVASLKPAAFVWTKADTIISAFERGAQITAGGTKYLAIPTAAFPRQQRRNTRGRFTAAGSLVRQAEALYGKLRFIPWADGRGGFLVARGRTRRSGRFALPTALAERRGQVQDVPLFVLVKEARVPRLLRGEAVRRRARQLGPQRFAVAFEVAIRREAAAQPGSGVVR